jgi:nicotinamide-nucleotide amidase
LPQQEHRSQRVIRTAGAGESMIDAMLSGVQPVANTTLGLIARPGVVDVRIMATGRTADAARTTLLESVRLVSDRLGEHVFGFDEETLQAVVARELVKRDLSIVVAEAGLSGMLVGRLSGCGECFSRGVVLPAPVSADDLEAALQALTVEQAAQVGLGAALVEGGDSTAILISVLVSETGSCRHTRLSHGGHPDLAAERAANLALGALRRELGAHSG